MLKVSKNLRASIDIPTSGSVQNTDLSIRHDWWLERWSTAALLLSLQRYTQLGYSCGSLNTHVYVTLPCTWPQCILFQTTACSAQKASFHSHCLWFTRQSCIYINIYIFLVNAKWINNTSINNTNHFGIFVFFEIFIRIYFKKLLLYFH